MTTRPLGRYFAVAEYVNELEGFGEQVTEEQIILWRLEEIEDGLYTAEDLLEEQERARCIIQRLLEDAVLEVRVDSELPGQRVIGCGANYVSASSW